MSLWIIMAMSAYLLLAFSAVADKFLLTHAVPHPAAYAFYLGITGPLVLVLAPFGLRMLPVQELLIALVAGASYIIALYFMYSATIQTSVSRILPIEGGLVPVFTLILARVILGEKLTANQDWAFLFLVLGAVLVSLRHDSLGWHPSALKNAAIAAFLFATALVLTKYLFMHSNFVTGMVWTRLAFFATALCFLIPKQSRKIIFNAPRQAQKQNILIYYGARISGVAAGFLQNYAIALGSVTIVNALQGVQFTFLLILTTGLSLYFPTILRERITAATVGTKVFAIILITSGLVLLTT